MYKSSFFKERMLVPCYKRIVQEFTKPLQALWVVCRHDKAEFILGVKACNLVIIL